MAETVITAIICIFLYVVAFIIYWFFRTELCPDKFDFNSIWMFDVPFLIIFLPIFLLWKFFSIKLK